MNQKFKIAVVLVAVAVLFALNASAWAAEVEKININTASAEELVTLEKIGPKLAESIIEFREKNGPFEKPEDIIKVKGIGEKTYELIKDRIVVEVQQ